MIHKYRGLYYFKTKKKKKSNDLFDIGIRDPLENEMVHLKGLSLKQINKQINK